MHKILALSAVTAVFAGHALAQCSTYGNSPPGANVVAADDALRVVLLPFAFPFNGTSYTQLTLCTNGWMKLGTTTNTATDLSDTEALMINSTVNANNMNPRIAVCWDDLNATTAGVFFNATSSQASICWKGVPRFSSTTAFVNCECILTVAGDIYLNYDASCTFNLSTSSSIVGISKSTGTVLAGTHLFDL